MFLPSLVFSAKRTCAVPGGVRLRLSSPTLLLRIDLRGMETSDASEAAGLDTSIALHHPPKECSTRQSEVWNSQEVDAV